MSPRPRHSERFRPAVLNLVLCTLGMGGAAAVGMAAVGANGEGKVVAVRDAPTMAPAMALSTPPDTGVVAPPEPWAIPALTPARVEIRGPGPPSTAGDDPLPPLIVLTTADAPPAPDAPALPGARSDLSAPFPLTAREVEAILAPLPELPSPVGPAALPGPGAPSDSEVPTPATGTAPGAGDNPPPPEPARVLGVFPSGEVEVAPDVTVLFSHPVAPLGATGEAHSVPFRWDPEVPGSWYWLDATTARFLPRDGRLPGGQSYRLRVDPEYGGPSAEGLSRPLPHETRLRIRGPLALGGSGGWTILTERPVLVLGFDQEVDPDLVATHASFQVLHGDPGADPSGLPVTGVIPAVARSLEEAPEEHQASVQSGRYPGAAALSPAEPLPPGSWVRLELDPELTSLEGPETTGRRQTLPFRTADVFHFRGTRCATPESACTPGTSHTLTFSNPVDPAQPLADRVRLTPEVPDLAIRTWGTSGLDLHGTFEPWTTYEVVIAADLVDVFGNTLESPTITEIHFGRARHHLAIRGAPFVSLDPLGRRELELPTRSLDRIEVRVLAADLARWGEWVYSGPTYRSDPEARTRGLREIERIELRPEDDGTGFSFLHLSLDQALAEAGGQVVVVASGYREIPGDGADRERLPAVVTTAWVQLPSLRIQLAADGEQMTVLTRAVDGTPAEGVRLSLPDAGLSAVSDAEGLASLSLPTAAGEAAHLLVAEEGGRVTLVPAAPLGGGYPRWLGQEGAPGPAWAVTVDRPLYRPGESLAFQGWVQETVPGPARDWRAPERIQAVGYEVRVSTDGGGERTVGSGEVEVSPSGGFHAVLDLPDDLAPGGGRVRLSALTEDASGATGPEPGWVRELTFRTADFRRPDYAVTVSRSPGVLLPDETFEVAAEARYFDGPGLPDSELRWTLQGRRGAFTPPGWLAPLPDPTGQGRSIPGISSHRWHFGAAPSSPILGGSRPGAMEPVTHDARTDAEGRHRLQVTPTAPRYPFPLYLGTSVTVQDLNRQAGSASAGATLLPGEVVPGIRLLPLAANATGPLAEGDSVEVEVVLLDAEGMVIPGDRRGAPRIRMERLTRDPDSEPFFPRWLVEGSTRVECRPDRVPTPQGSSQGSAVEGYRCRAALPEEGVWLASVEVTDARGRMSRAESNVTVHGPGTRLGWGFGAGGGPFGIEGQMGFGEGLELELEGSEEPGFAVLPGDTLTLRIRAPFDGGQGMALLDHGGIRRVEAIRMDPGEAGLRIRFPVEGAPGNRAVEVLLESPDGTRAASGAVNFEVAPHTRRLTLAVQAPEERVEPGATVPVEVRVTGDGETPIPGAEVTIWLVDEAAFFAAGTGARRFSAEALDPWDAFYRVGRGIQARGGVWLHSLRERRPPAEGELQLRLLDAYSGRAVGGTLEVAGGAGWTRSARPDPNGEILMRHLPPGDLRVRFFPGGNEPVFERSLVRDGNDGVDLGTILVPSQPPPQRQGDAQAALQLRQAPRSPSGPLPFTVALNELVVTGNPFLDTEAMQLPPEIELPPPPEGTPTSDSPLLRENFASLAGIEPRVVTDGDGVARATFRLPDTLTRYRILAVARSGGAEAPAVGAGEGLVVAGQELVVRASPPRFLRSGDLGDISLLVENGGAEEREVEVALRASGIALEGPAGVRLRVPAGARREVSFPARAATPGVARIQARGVAGPVSDAVAVQLPVEIPAAPERTAFRALLGPGASRTLVLEPWAAVNPEWGELEVMASPSLLGGLGAELATLAGTQLPWPGLRVARVRGAAALVHAMERDPALGAALDSAALAALHQAVSEDMVALGEALEWVRGDLSSYGGLLRAAVAMGTRSVATVLEASDALEEARRAGLLSSEPAFRRAPAPLEPALVQILLLSSLRQPEARPPGLGAIRTLDLILLWTLHRSGEGLSILPSSVQQAVAGLDTENLRPVWLARIAAMLAAAEAQGSQGQGIQPGAHRAFLEALENRARITPGGVTFRRGSPLQGTAGGTEPASALSFSVSSPVEDAEILLALTEVAPDHPLLPGLVASVATADPVTEAGASAEGGPRTTWGPEVAGRALPALEAWAQIHAQNPVDAEVLLRLGSGEEASGGVGLPLHVRSGDPTQTHRIAISRLLEAQGGRPSGTPDSESLRLSLPLSLEIRSPDSQPSGAPADASGGILSTRVLLSWTAADPLQPAMTRGFVVRRSYEGVDDPDDVRRDADGSWRVRAGARIRISHELLLAEQRVDVRFEDPFPAGLEPIQGTTGDEGAGQASAVEAAEILLDGRWRLTGGVEVLVAVDGLRWYREMRFGRDQVTAWAPALRPGIYRGSWVARATTPGDFIVPGARAWEAARPDVLGRSGADRVVVEAW